MISKIKRGAQKAFDFALVILLTISLILSAVVSKLVTKAWFWIILLFLGLYLGFC